LLDQADRGLSLLFWKHSKAVPENVCNASQL
jgi:hypothetical protein